MFWPPKLVPLKKLFFFVLRIWNCVQKKNLLKLQTTVKKKKKKEAQKIEQKEKKKKEV